jgi:hypothetical protein
MFYRYALITLTAFLILTVPNKPLSAQGRGGHGGGMGAGMGAGVGRVAPGTTFGARSTPVVRNPGIATQPAFRNNPGIAAQPVFRGRNFNAVRRPGVVAGTPFYGGFSPFYSPFYSSFYSPYYDPYSYPYSYPDYSQYSPYLYSSPVYAQPGYGAPGYGYDQPTVTQNDDLGYQIQQLQQQIDQLQQQQAAVTYAPPVPVAPPAPAEHPSIPTTLIFRDGRRMAVNNYAIVGDTLWILDQKGTTKIPLSSLDLNATQKENRGLGVRFQVPER